MHLATIVPTEIFQALADPTRIRLVKLLDSSGEEACLCELVDSLLEPQYKLSRHIKTLKHAGLLSASKEGRWIYHRLVGAPGRLHFLYQFVRTLSNDDGIFAADLQRFRARLRLRRAGRCRVGMQTAHLAVSDYSDRARPGTGRNQSRKGKSL